MKIGWFGKNGVQGTNLLDRFISVLGCLKSVQNLNFGPDRLFFRFSQALVVDTHLNCIDKLMQFK